MKLEGPACIGSPSISCLTIAGEGLNAFPSAPAIDQDVPSQESAIRNQLGLTLDKRDGLLRVLVVDKAEEVPTPNLAP
jgi:uncharacterized protein (TIGR03435 family)